MSTEEELQSQLREGSSALPSLHHSSTQSPAGCESILLGKCAPLKPQPAQVIIWRQLVYKENKLWEMPRCTSDLYYHFFKCGPASNASQQKLTRGRKETCCCGSFQYQYWNIAWILVLYFAYAIDFVIKETEPLTFNFNNLQTTSKYSEVAKVVWKIINIQNSNFLGGNHFHMALFCPQTNHLTTHSGSVNADFPREVV